LLDFTEQRFDLGKRWRDQLRGHVALVGEIDSSFDQRGGFDDLRAPVTRSVAEQPLQLTQRLAALTIGVGVDQIIETFGLGEIELAVLEPTSGENSPGSAARIWSSAESVREQCRQNRAPAVDVKFGDVFSGRTCRSRKPKHHPIVDPAADCHHAAALASPSAAAEFFLRAR